MSALKIAHRGSKSELTTAALSRKETKRMEKKTSPVDGFWTAMQTLSLEYPTHFDMYPVFQTAP